MRAELKASSLMFPQGTVMDGLANLPTTGTTTRIHGRRLGELDPSPARSNQNKPTHAATLGFAYVNEVGRDGFQRQPFSFPVGSVIVRETLLAPDANPDRLVVMIKHERSFNRRANGWEFLTVNGAGTKILKREKNGRCLRCHSASAENDFVFPEEPRR